MQAGQEVISSTQQQPATDGGGQAWQQQQMKFQTESSQAGQEVNSSVQQPQAADIGGFKVGMKVDAQCAGWGPEWYPGMIRELLPNGELQILWDGEEPSISNVPPESVRQRPEPQPTVIDD